MWFSCGCGVRYWSTPGGYDLKRKRREIYEGGKR